MPLYIGDSKIKDIYVGSQKIAKAYVGENLVFSAKKPSRLPDGYTELEYIRVGPNNTTLRNFSLATANAKQVLNLDLTIVAFPTGGTPLLYSSRPCILYSKVVANDTEQCRDVLYLSKTGLYANSSTASALSKNEIQLSADMTVPQRVSVLWDGPNKCISINGGTAKNFPIYGVGSNWLLGSTTAGSGTHDCWREASVRIHSIKISREDSASSSYNKDYVPARDSSGRVGFYDLLNDKFIYHSSLAAGPAI